MMQAGRDYIVKLAWRFGMNRRLPQDNSRSPQTAAPMRREDLAKRQNNPAPRLPRQ